MAWVEYQARFITPAYIERDRDTLLTLGLYSAGALAAPSSGTISIFDAAGVAVVDGGSVVITADEATYTAKTSNHGSLSLSSGWRVEWSLTMPDGYVHVVRQDAALVRMRLHPVITDADLLARHTDLTNLRPSALTSYEDYIIEAWREIVGQLEERGRRPYLVISAQALRGVHLYTTLGLIFRDFAGSGDPTNRWFVEAERYEARAREAWASLTLAYDEDDDGKADSTRRSGGMTSVWLAGRS